MPSATEPAAPPIGPAWARIREMTRAEIGGSAFENWITPLELEDAEGPVAVLSAPTSFIGKWVGEHYGDVLTRMISTEFVEVKRLEFRLRARAGAAAAPAAAPCASAPSPAEGQAPLGGAGCGLLAGRPGRRARGAGRRWRWRACIRGAGVR